MNSMIMRNLLNFLLMLATHTFQQLGRWILKLECLSGILVLSLTNFNTGKILYHLQALVLSSVK